MAAHERPRVRRTAQNTQYVHDLGRRIYDIKTYPVLSPQGATILIYAHDVGLTIVWRGGRRLKPLQHDAGKGRQNGARAAADDAVMIIDSDDDEPAQAAAAPPFVDKPEFEEESAEEGTEYPETTQTLELSLGTAVLHIGVLPIAPCAAEDAPWAGADILAEKLVFAVSCATASAYVVTLPLTPPSHESKARESLTKDLFAGNAGKGQWGETLIQLAGQNMHSSGIALGLVKRKSSERSRSRDRSRPSSSSSSPTRVVVAADTREARGTLRLWDVTVASNHGDGGEKSIFPFQTEYLPSFATGISFNPTHTTQLLVATSPHAVRLYDYSIPSLPADDASEGPFPSQGSWLLSLYPPFVRGSSATSTSRKPVIAAAWISNGRAILVLLADGQWGIWDLEGAGPSTGGGKSGAGLRGSSLTAFSATGYLEGTSPLRTGGSERQSGVNSEFVPMTPHTRRDVMSSALAGGLERLATVHGGIEVVRLPPLRGTGTVAGADESAVLWLGVANAIITVIPGIARFWDAQLQRGGGGGGGGGVNLFSGAQPSRMLRLNDLGVGLAGERCCGIGAILKATRRRGLRSAARENGAVHDQSDNDEGSGRHSGGLPIEVLIRGDTRLVVVREREEMDDASVKTRLLAARKKRVGERRSGTEAADAIIVYPPRPEHPIDLSVGRAGGNNAALGITDRKAAFALGQRLAREPFAPSERASQQQEQPTTKPMPASALPTRLRDAGLGFADSLDRAADAEESGGEVDERAVEEELLDVMDIDRMLEEMEDDRDSGQKHVFFEEDEAL